MSKAPQAAILADELAEYRIIDMHQHIGSWATSGGYPEPSDSVDHQEFDARFEFMSGYGIDATVVHPCQQSGSDAATVTRRNADVLDALGRYPDRFAGGLAALPLTDSADIDREWERVRDAPFSGLTFHPRFSAKTTNTPLMDRICARAEERGWPIAMHAFAESKLEALWRLDILARRFPRVTFVALAAFSSVDQTQQILDLVERRSNIHFDTALMVPAATVIAELCRSVGAGRLLFGSDLYMVPRRIFACPSTLFEIVATSLPRSDKERILGGNAIELFALGRRSVRPPPGIASPPRGR